MSPLVAFLIVFVVLLLALIKFKVSPSVGLFAAAIIFGLMVGMPAADILNTLPAGFGNMMKSIGLLIVFGSIFGDILGESGATEELAKGMVRLFGKKNDLLALNLVGFILSIPIYFGCAYIMTAPLVNALQKISRKSMKGYVIAIFTGLMLTHSCVAPTPGPLAVAGQIGANIGWFIIWGIVVCLPASLLVGWLYANSASKGWPMHGCATDCDFVVRGGAVLSLASNGYTGVDSDGAEVDEPVIAWGKEHRHTIMLERSGNAVGGVYVAEGVEGIVYEATYEDEDGVVAWFDRGTWGSSESAADHVDDVHFAGPGVIKVQHDRRVRPTLMILR